MSEFHVVTEWRTAASRAQVWDVLLNVREWPSWWRGFRQVDQLASGDDRGIGMRLRQQWRSHLPLTMTLELEVIDIRSRELLVGRIAGEMTGTATWTMREEDGETVVRFAFDVAPVRPWMRLPVPFADRVFAWNYGAVMAWGRDGLARRLDAAVAGRSVLAAAAAA